MRFIIPTIALLMALPLILPVPLLASVAIYACPMVVLAVAGSMRRLS